MQQTEQYGLNQWELTDRIRMEDFNADNLKIAEALAGKLGHMQTLTNIKGSSGRVGMSSTNLTKVNWANYELVFYHGSIIPGTTLQDNTITFALPLQSGPTLKISEEDFLLVFFPRHNPNQLVSGILLCGAPKLFTYNNTYSDLTALGINPANGSCPDYHLQLIGMT